MQAFHITETRAIVPITRKLRQLRFTIDDLIGSMTMGLEEEESEGQRGRLSTRRIGQLIPNAVLRCQSASPNFIKLVLTYDRQIRIPEFIGRERRYQTVTYPSSSVILWRPETGFCFVLDLPRRAIKAITWMLSAAVLGYPGRLSPLEIDYKRMRQSIGYLISPPSGGPGELMRAIFRDIEVNGAQLDEINLRAHELHKLKLYRDVQKGASHLHAISFITPIISGIGRPLVCRMDSGGSVQVYSRRLADDEIRLLLLYFEQMLKK